MRIRTLTVILSLFSLFMIFSCQRSEPVIELDNNYYPLGIGYEWTYDQLEGSIYTTRIIEESVINGKTYYRNENDYSDYFRTEDNVLYQYRRVENVEHAVIDFNKSVDYEWEHPFYERTFKILAKNITYRTIENCILISSESDIDYSEDIFAPGIGLVSSHIEGRGNVIIICGNNWCTSATINGETINFEE